MTNPTTPRPADEDPTPAGWPSWAGGPMYDEFAESAPEPFDY